MDGLKLIFNNIDMDKPEEADIFHREVTIILQLSFECIRFQ